MKSIIGFGLGNNDHIGLLLPSIQVKFVNMCMYCHLELAIIMVINIK
jgi:hypothetical protein